MLDKTGLKFSQRDITKTRVFKYVENFTSKNWKFSDKNSDICHISAQKIDCKYSLEPPCEAVLTSTHNLCFWAETRKIIYSIPCKPLFYNIKVGFKGVNIIRAYRHVFVMTRYCTLCRFPSCITWETTFMTDDLFFCFLYTLWFLKSVYSKRKEFCSCGEQIFFFFFFFF